MRFGHRPSEAPRRGRALAVGLALLLGACGGASFRNGIFKSDEVHYRVGPVDREWTRLQVSEGQVAFVVPGTGATLSAHAECRRTDAPLRALTLHILNGFTERKVAAERFFSFAAREAMGTSLTARLDGVPMQLEVVVVKKDACVFDFVYTAPPERFAERRPDFERFLGGFEKLPQEKP